MKMKNKVLAVLALALLIINMAPVRVAEAAMYEGYTVDGVTLPDIRDMVWADSTVEMMENLFGEGVDIYNKIVSDNRYMIIQVNQSQNPNYRWAEFLFSDYPAQYTGEVGVVPNTKTKIYTDAERSVVLSADYETNIISIKFGYGNKWEYGGTVQSVYPFDVTSTNRSNKVFGSTYDYYEADKYNSNFPRNNLIYPEVLEPEPVYDYVYSSSGPIAATSSAGISNLMKFVPAGADSLDDFYVKSNWEEWDNWRLSFTYRVDGELPALAGSDPTNGDMYKVYSESVIALPSKEVVSGWISSGMAPVELYFEKGQSNWHQTVYDGKDTFITVKVINESVPNYHSLMNGKHAFQVEIPMKNIMALIDESFDGGLRGYYGLSQEMWEMWKNSVYEYTLPYELYTVLYAKEDVDTMIYGNMYYSVPNWTDIDQTSKGYVFYGGVIEKPLEDITDNDKQEIQIDTTRDELAKRLEELEQLKKEYEESLKLNGETDDLFGMFSDVAGGIRSSSGTFKSISTAVGNVFAFFPEEITGILYAGFIAMVIIAVYKALRG